MNLKKTPYLKWKMNCELGRLTLSFIVSVSNENPAFVYGLKVLVFLISLSALEHPRFFYF